MYTAQPYLLFLPLISLPFTVMQLNLSSFFNFLLNTGSNLPFWSRVRSSNIKMMKSWVMQTIGVDERRIGCLHMNENFIPETAHSYVYFLKNRSGSWLKWFINPILSSKVLQLHKKQKRTKKAFYSFTVTVQYNFMAGSVMFSLLHQL